MKRRVGFISNSSSSSFIIMETKSSKIYSVNEEDKDCYDYEVSHINIDYLIKELKKAKDNGETEIKLIYGGGYDG